ncbi:penicillin-binding protein activator [Bradyrhizobium sp. HKCCYLR20261]|uniref:penicillin-binding protein activator n=1 Tax=Bradyrhizobium sp. HKCCYLR20261 TaxID=3420760 RepID=UPI003EBC5808
METVVMALSRTRSLSWRMIVMIAAAALAGSPGAASAASAEGLQVKVALVLPISASGELGKSARAIRQGFEMAVAEWQELGIAVLVEDDGGDPDRSERALRRVLDLGARLIVGPQLPGAVGKVSETAVGAGVPVICLTAEPIVAAPNLFRLDVDRDHMADAMIAFSRSRGLESFGALLPDAKAGRRVEDALRKSVADRGSSLIVERYPAGGEPPRDALRKLADASVGAVFLYDDLGNVGRIARMVKADGGDLAKAQFVGTVNWASYTNLSEPALDGGWFVSPELRGLGAFENRYTERFGEAPTAMSYLAYDAGSLAVALFREHGPRGIDVTTISQPSGFFGVMGLFRFRRDGSTERGFGVFRVDTAHGPQVLSPPPTKFESE